MYERNLILAAQISYNNHAPLLQEHGSLNTIKRKLKEFMESRNSRMNGSVDFE